MKIIHWNDNYSIGNSDVDYDHLKLFQTYNRLAEMAIHGTNNLKFAEALSELTDYSLLHFKREEEYMKEISYPHFEQHRKKHLDYTLKIAFFNSDLSSNKPPEITEIIHFIESWWTNHISRCDKAYEQYKAENNIKADY